jgi:hypothetical protein
VTRAAVLTRYPHRPAEVGVPSENPNLAEPGLILTDFVDRVGDPVPLIAPDGSSHRAEAVLVDALRALLLTLFKGAPAAEPVGVAYPAHWRPAAIDALRGALTSVPEFRTPIPALLVSDATAALTALQHEPGVPARGVIALCDFGATGTSITLADAARGFQPIGPTVRHVDFSGELIDQALLTTVIAGLSAGVDVSGTSAIGSLGRLRAQCRGAKERLSTTTVTSMPVDLPGAGGDVRVTRNELDDAVRAPLDGFITELQNTLQRNGIRPADLAAVASVGGGARIPIVTTTLSEHLRVPVISSPAPELAAAIGGGLRAVRSTVQEDATSRAPAPVAVPPLAAPAAPDAPMSSTFRALAWSDADHVPDVAPSESYGEDTGYASYAEPAGESARPSLDFEPPDPEEEARAAVVPWYRRPVAIIAGAVLLVLLVVGGAIAYVLTSDESGTQTVPTTTASVTPPPSGSTVAPSGESPASQAPGETYTYTQAPPRTVTETAPPPPPENAPPPPSTEAPPPPTTTDAPRPTTTDAPVTTTTVAPTTTSNQPPWSPPYSTIPGLPYVPAPPGFLPPQQP